MILDSLTADDPERWPDECCGPDGLHHCRFAPRFTVAGDGACVYHLVAIVRMRSREVRGPSVPVFVIPAGAAGTLVGAFRDGAGS